MAGRTAYAASCAGCHQANLSGSGEQPPLAGQGFMTAWGRRTAKELYDDIRAQMSELVTAERSGKDVREIEYANTFQGLGLGAAHDTSLTFLKAGTSALLQRETAARQNVRGDAVKQNPMFSQEEYSPSDRQSSAQSSNAGLAHPAGRPYSRQEGRIHRWQRSTCW